MKKKIAIIFLVFLTAVFVKKDLLKECFHELTLEMAGVSEEEYLRGKKYVASSHYAKNDWHRHSATPKRNISFQPYREVGSTREGKTFKNPENLILGFRLDRGFRFKKEAVLTSSDLVANYGEGCLEEKSELIETRIYNVSNNTRVKIYFGHTDEKVAYRIEIYEEPVSSSCKPKIAFETLDTGKGLALNNDLFKLRKLYPNPTYILDENDQRFHDFEQIRANEACYMFIYEDCVISSESEEFAALPPYSTMEVKVCNSKVKMIGLYYYVD